MIYPLLLAFLLLGACSSKPESPVLATINGQKITVEEFKQYFETERWKFGAEANLDQSQLKQTKAQVLDIVFKDYLLLQEANKRGIAVSSKELDASIKEFKSSYPSSQDFNRLLKVRGWNWDAFKQRRNNELKIKKLVEHVTMQQVHLDEEELQKYYDAHQGEFNHAEEIHARQIVTDSFKKASALRAMLIKGEKFDDIAFRYSLSPDRKAGGDLGWFSRGMMPAEFDNVCFSLKEGELSPVVKTPYGFHLFEVLKKKSAGITSFDEAKDHIRQKLLQAQGKNVFQKWYEQLHAHARVKINEEILGQVD